MTSDQSYSTQSGRDAIVPRQVDPLGAPAYYPDYSYASYYGGAQSESANQAGGGLGALLQVARRRWWIVLGVAAAISAGTWWHTLRLPSVYSSRFLLLVNVSVDRATRTNEDIPIERAKELSFSTLIQVLRSKLVLNQVVADLKETYPDIELGDLAENLNIRLARDTDVLIVTYQNTDPTRVKDVLDRVSAAYLQYGSTQARVNVQQGIDFVESKLPELRARVETLRAQVKDFRQTYNLYDPDARGGQLAAEIASIEQRQEMLKIDLTAAQSSYARLQDQLGYEGDSAPQTAIATDSLSNSPLYKQRLDELQKIEAEIARESTRFSANSPMIRSLQERKRQLEPLLEEAASEALRGRSAEGAGSSPLNGIDLEFNRELIETTNQIAQFQVQASELEKLKADKEEQFRTFPSISNDYLALQQDLGRANESLNNFLNAQEEYSLQASQDSIPWQQITPASTPIKPISPDIPRQMAIGTVAGLALGVGLAMLVEKSDNVYHSPETMREGLQLPLLGTIPMYKALQDSLHSSPEALTSGNGKHLLTGDTGTHAATCPLVASTKGKQSRYNLSPFLEAFRSLNANLNFLGTNKPIRAVTISSAAPGDGKSTVATYLAQAAAAMGQRVLLVDADLRRPQVHSIMRLENKRGFSDAIGREFPLRDAIQQSPWEKNLFVLPSGRIPPDPTRLLSSRKAQRIMDKLQSVFDLVIYDAPPLLGIADSTLLSKRTDGIVLVIGMDKTNRNAVNEAFTNLRMAGSTVLGTVANRVRQRSPASGYYDYTSDYAEEVDEDDFESDSATSNGRNDEVAAV